MKIYRIWATTSEWSEREQHTILKKWPVGQTASEREANLVLAFLKANGWEVEIEPEETEDL